MSNVTSFEQLQQYAQGQLVELPPFAEGMPFVAKMKRPSLLALMKSGKIPNALLSTANSLFSGTQAETAKFDDDAYKEIFEVVEILTEAALIEPSLKTIKDAGLELTDDQLMFIFNYTQRGVKALEPFRTEQTNNQGIESQSSVQSAT